MPCLAARKHYTRAALAAMYIGEFLKLAVRRRSCRERDFLVRRSQLLRSSGYHQSRGKKSDEKASRNQYKIYSRGIYSALGEGRTLSPIQFVVCCAVRRPSIGINVEAVLVLLLINHSSYSLRSKL